MKPNPLIKSSTGKSINFVSIGECMVEMAPAQDPANYKMSFAGDTYNTLWYLKKLRPNWTTQYITRVGDDSVSSKMLDLMNQAKTGTDYIQIDQNRGAGLYMVSLKDGERSFSYWRDGSAARLLAQDVAHLQASIANADVVYFSGISIAILEGTGRDNLLSVLRTARAAGKTVVFDPNLRPRLWDNAEQMKQYIMKSAEVSDIVLPSYDDEADHFQDADMTATRDRYLAAGATTVVVKNGAGEMTCTDKGETIHVTPPVAKAVVDTTAAGDSFNAGFFAGLEQCDTLQDALLMGANVAGQVIAQRGALVPVKI